MGKIKRGIIAIKKKENDDRRLKIKLFKTKKA